MCYYLNYDLFIAKTFYFFFFAAFGSLFPLLAVYFKQIGMTASQSGMLMGFRPFIEFCSAPLWGSLADRWKKAKHILLFSLFCWIVFTLALVWIQPAPHACLVSNNTHIILQEVPTRIRRDTSLAFENLNKEIFPRYGSYLVQPDLSRSKRSTAYALSNRRPKFEEWEIGDDSENYGKQRMFGSLGWGLSMFFVGIALDNSNVFTDHPCGDEIPGEKNYTVCFAVFSVLMSCAFIAATQFRFMYNGVEERIPLDKVTEKLKDKMHNKLIKFKNYDKSQLIEEEQDDEHPYGQREKPMSEYERIEREIKGDLPGDKSKLQISMDDQGGTGDMVTDAVSRSGMYRPGTSDQGIMPNMPKWMTIFKCFGTIRYALFLFIAWFMGFGIGLVFTFLFWHLQDLGGTPTIFGLASVINHVSEIIAYFFSANLINKIGHVKVLYLGLLGNVGRFLYISWLTNPWWALPFEFVQGLTHAAVWAACCSYLTQAIPQTLRSSAQGLLQGVHHGLGRGCGAIFGGLLIHYCGSAYTFRGYGFACLLVLLVFVIATYFLKEKSPDLEAPNKMMEENLHLAPCGVPMAPDKKVIDEQNHLGGYGATTGSNEGDSFADKYANSYQQSQGHGNQEGYGYDQGADYNYDLGSHFKGYQGMNTQGQQDEGGHEPRQNINIQGPNIATEMHMPQPDDKFAVTDNVRPW
ncbi:unnamed protein product [Owenia fusiformis]|uniref:Major facilitator superfamily associated domain-containing protein n=1 Tax=Owenia fusiformis TaxID=6347 RepID=A0A8S4MVC2_OWEFU|nr:unnamed protein product [Owenia fusiformis]